MTLNAREVPSGGTPIDPVEAGTYPTRTVRILDMGVQEQSYNNEPKPPKQELNITYEALDEFLKDEDGNDNEEKPRWFSENFPLNNLNSEKAKSTARYYALDPDESFDGDWTKLLDIPCMVTVVQQPDKKNPKIIRNKIANVSAMRPKEASKAKELVNPPQIFSLDDVSEENKKLFESLPDWIKDRIKKSLEWESTPFYKSLGSEKPKAKKEKEPVKDSIPFEKDEEEDDGNW